MQQTLSTMLRHALSQKNNSKTYLVCSYGIASIRYFHHLFRHIGSVSNETMLFLRTLERPLVKNDSGPVHLFSTNLEVDVYNAKR